MKIFSLLKKKKKKTSGSFRSFHGVATGRLYSSWSTGTSLNDAIKSDLAGVRDRSRDLERNDDYVKRYLKLSETNLVGPKGIALQCRFRDSKGNLNTGVNDDIEAAFAQWGERGSCDVTGKHSWVGVQNLVVRSLKADGEAFVRMVSGSLFNSVGFALQILRPEDIDENFNFDPGGGGNVIVQGIEFNGWKRPVAYYVKAADRDKGVVRVGGTAWLRVPADEMLHIFEPLRSEQVRGVPDTRTTTGRLKMLEGFQEATLVDARAAACKGGFFKKTSLDAEPFTGDAEKPGERDDWDRVLTDHEPGMYSRIPVGWEFQPRNHDSPHESYSPFIKTNLQGVGASLNTSYSALANDYEGVNYSSLRAALQIERDIYETQQTFLVEALVQPVYRRWLAHAASMARVRVRPSQVYRYETPHFAPRRWPWVDPQKEAQANATAVDKGFKSLTEVASERGRSIEDIFFEKKREAEMAKELGLKLGLESTAEETA